MPSVHRREFIAQADKKKPDHENVEDRVLWLERMMLNEFRTAGAADLDVGYCQVRAPFDAYVTNLNIAVGEYARQGQRVFALVDNRAWYVLANFSETYMSSIKPGMEADVYLVTYPRRSFRGVVQGIGWATRPDDGETVGVLPAVQRTLNWVRLANRFQVRVRIEERDADHPFRMGTTAVVDSRFC